MSKGSDQKIKTLVIGAGIVGTSIAYHLSRRGANVVILDRVGPAAGATGKSFAWVNAHHFKKPDYHRLRYQSLSEYHRLERELRGDLGLNWCGALSFDAVGEAFDQRYDGFRQLGYPAEIVSHNRFRMLEPHYGHPPGRALHLSLEAAIEPVMACNALISAAVQRGAQTLFGCDIVALRQDQGRLIGVETSEGPIDADHVVMAAGAGAEPILTSAGVDLPMANQTGVLLKSRPVETRINHVIWGDRIHMKQQADGRIVIGEVFSETWTKRDPSSIAEQMLGEAKRHLPDIDLVIEHTTVGLRPIPKDGMPVVGAVDSVSGLYIAVMHSGITLAPIVGRMAADEMLDSMQFDTLAPYRLSRFQDAKAKAAS
jgi:glycine/D-amino acid oxidase-like deaminating enzyme